MTPRTARRSNWLDLAQVQLSSAENEKLDRELRNAKHIQIQLQSALEAERINHHRARRESRAIQSILEDTNIELKALKEENSRLREENRLLQSERQGQEEVYNSRSRAPSLSLHPMEPDNQSTLITSPLSLAKTLQFDDAGDNVAKVEQVAEAASAATTARGGEPAEPRLDVCGVGVRVSETAPFRIAGCAVGGPAHRGGDIRPGDLLLAVDGVPTRGLSPTSVRRRIAGPPGTYVSLQLARAGHAAAGEDSSAVYTVTLQRTPSRSWRPPSGDAAAALRPAVTPTRDFDSVYGELLRR